MLERRGRAGAPGAATSPSSSPGQSSRIPKFRAASLSRGSPSSRDRSGGEMVTKTTTAPGTTGASNRFRRPQQPNRRASVTTIGAARSEQEVGSNTSSVRHALSNNNNVEDDKGTTMKPRSGSRRQWSSLDHSQGGLEMELDGNVRLPAWERNSFVGVGASDEEENEEEDGESTAETFVISKPGDLHFRKLKENLAEEGTMESLKKMADDLLQGLAEDSCASAEEETRYRQEQAMFWLMKSAERGSSEALERLRAMAAAGRGVTAANAAEVEEFASAKDTSELVGRRVGRKIYSSCVEARGAVTLTVLDKISDQKDKSFSSLTAFPKRSERVKQSALLEAGKLFVRGEVPSKLDERLTSLRVQEKRMPLLSIIVVRIYLALLSISQFLLWCLGLPAVQAACVLALYDAVFSFQVHLIVISNAKEVICFVAASTAVTVAGKTVAHKCKQRKWDLMFLPHLREEEKAQAKKSWSGNRMDNLTVVMACVVGAVLTTNEGTVTRLAPAVIAFAAAVVAVKGRTLGLLISAILVAAQNASVEEFVQTTLKDLSPDFEEHISTYIQELPALALALTFALPLLLFSCGLRSCCEILSASLVVSHFSSGGSEIYFLASSGALVAISVLLMLAERIRRKRKILPALGALVILALALLFSEKNNILNPPRVKISWNELSESCPLDGLGPADQAACLRGFLDTEVDWEGKVTSVRVLRHEGIPDLNLPQSVVSALENVHGTFLGLPPSCDGVSPIAKTLAEQNFCSAVLGRPQHRCRIGLMVGSRSSLFGRRDPSEVEVEAGAGLWGNCSALAERGQELRVRGILKSIFERRVVEATSISGL